VMLFSNVVDVDLYQRVESPPGFATPALLCPGSYYSPESPMAAVSITAWAASPIPGDSASPI
jgi:hypothetical protein